LPLVVVFCCGSRGALLPNAGTLRPDACDEPQRGRGTAYSAGDGVSTPYSRDSLILGVDERKMACSCARAHAGSAAAQPVGLGWAGGGTW